MGDPLRDCRPATELAAKRQVVEFSAKISDFERFSAAVEADLATLPEPGPPPAAGQQTVTGRLVFSESPVPGVSAGLSGRVRTRVTSVCQRCLETFDWPLEVQLNVDLVEPGQPPAEREGFETWELESATIRPIDIVDEALVMALPLSPRHEDPAACAGTGSPEAGEEAGEEMTRPFADLRSRLDDDKDDDKRD